MLRQCLACTIAVLSAVCLPAIAAGGASRPTVRVMDLAPVKVKGSSFQRLERLRVVLRTGEDRRVRRVRARRTGSFRLTFPGTGIDRCNEDVLVIVTGSKGSRADSKLPMLQCPPAL